MPKEIPILMTGDNAIATIEDRKTQTRRLNNLHEINKNPDDWDFDGFANYSCYRDTGEAIFINRNTGKVRYIKNPFGRLGDNLWVRETWQYNPFGGIVYQAGSGIIDCDGRGWKPSIHMFKWMCRCWCVRTEDIRLERVQDITTDNSIREGIPWSLYEENKGSFISLARAKFWQLWDSINAKRGYGWDRNPWVWVVSYKRIKRGGKEI